MPRRHPIVSCPPAAVVLPILIAAIAVIGGACSASPGQAPSFNPASSVSPASSAGPASATPSESPSPATAAPPSVSADVPTGCLGLEPNECLGVREIALSRLPSGSGEVAYVRVGRFGCLVDGPCAANLAERPEGAVVIEFVDGASPVVVSIRTVGDAVQASVEPETFFVLVQPQSAAVAGPATQTELGHCGVGSGIDVDGSFWNPVGIVEADHGDYLNAAPATFTLLTETTARLETANGMRLDLVRHPGPKQLELCD